MFSVMHKHKESFPCQYRMQNNLLWLQLVQRLKVRQVLNLFLITVPTKDFMYSTLFGKAFPAEVWRLAFMLSIQLQARYGMQ